MRKANTTSLPSPLTLQNNSIRASSLNAATNNKTSINNNVTSTSSLSTATNNNTSTNNNVISISSSNTSDNNNNNNNNDNNDNDDTEFTKTTGWWTLPCKHIVVYIGKYEEICRWGINTTQKMKKLTGLTKARYDRKSLIDILKLAYLITITCDDDSIYYNSWLDYNEAEQALITNKLFQQHNKQKYKKDIIQNIWKETKIALKEWIKLVCII